MKKIVLLIMLFGSMMSTFAQDGIDIYITDYPASMELCALDGLKVYVIPEDSCGFFVFFLNGTMYPNANPLVIDPAYGYNFEVSYDGCNVSHQFNVTYGRQVPNAYTKDVWIPEEQETVILTAVGTDSIYYYQHAWSNGSNNWYIEAGEGTYRCELSNACGSATRTFMVRKNVEIYRATVDLATNLNKVTWQTNESQAEYISQVKVERDGMVVGTVPYGDGQFLDNIGSENAARNYRLVAITTEGIECPFPSYQLGTLHVDFSPNANDPNKINMAWTPPYIEEGAPLTVTYFQICKYDPATGEVTVVDQIGANNTIGSYNISLFDGGYATVAAVFSEGKDYEELSFSNMTEDILSIGENAGNQIRIYPNPAKGHFTVEGEGMMHISNVLGQEIMAKEIDGKETMELPQGMYFVQLNGTVRKIVVE